MGGRFRGRRVPSRNTGNPVYKASEKFTEALLLHQRGNVEAAKALYTEILQIEPRHFDCLHLLGVALWQTGQAEAGVQKIRLALSITPDYPPAYNNLGNVLRDLKRSTEALDSYDKALQLNSAYAEAHNNRGNALRDLCRLEEAVTSYEKAIQLKKEFYEAWNNLGNAFTDLNRPADALAAYDAAVAIKDDFADAHSNRGQALLKLRRYHDAEASCRRAVTLRPGFAEGYNNLGAALKELGRFDEAIECYNRALELAPRFKEALNNRGLALAGMQRYTEAIQSYNRAIEIDAKYAGAYANRGNAERDQRKFAEAIVSYRTSLDINPDTDFLFGTYLHTKLKVCDWSTLDQDIRFVRESVLAKRKVLNPFVSLITIDDPELHLEVARLFGQTVYPEVNVTQPRRISNRKKIRVGYYSADYYNHATSYLMAQLIELHDRERFDIYGFTFSPKVNDELQQRMYSAFDSVIDITSMSDKEVANISRDLGIDIAVDLKGYTTDARTGIFAERCAPIQVNYLGYPGTMGVPYIDYIIVDKVVVPVEDQCHYTEKLAYLPNSYQINEPIRRVSDARISRRDVGLPEDGFVFCCFNNNYKIRAEIYSIWMNLLKGVPGSVLWLLEDNPAASMNLKREAQKRGVSEDRIIFAKRLKIDEHLARHVLADLFLDTLPCNAHTTASDALWMGVPVLTILGQAFAGRVAASLVTALNLSELVCRTVSEYEAKAMELALNPQKLSLLREKIVIEKHCSPLFDARLLTRNIEDLYIRMMQSYEAGAKPDLITTEEN